MYSWGLFLPGSISDRPLLLLKSPQRPLLPTDDRSSKCSRRRRRQARATSRCRQSTGDAVHRAHVPRESIARLLVRGGVERLRLIPGSAGSPRLLGGYVEALLTSGEALSPEAARMVAGHDRDLIAVSLEGVAGCAAGARERSVPAARLRAIRSDILAHPQNSGLNLPAIAARHRVSPRYVRDVYALRASASARASLPVAQKPAGRRPDHQLDCIRRRFWRAVIFQPVVLSPVPANALRRGAAGMKGRGAPLTVPAAAATGTAESAVHVRDARASAATARSAGPPRSTAGPSLPTAPAPPRGGRTRRRAKRTSRH